MTGVMAALGETAAPAAGTARQVLVGGVFPPMYINLTDDDLEYATPGAFMSED